MELHVHVYCMLYWWEHGNIENKNKLVEWKAFVDSMGIKSANLEDGFFSKVCGFLFYHMW